MRVLTLALTLLRRMVAVPGYSWSTSGLVDILRVIVLRVESACACGCGCASRSLSGDASDLAEQLKAMVVDVIAARLIEIIRCLIS